MRKKILFYCPYLGRGGAEKHFVRLFNELPATRFDKIMVCSKNGGEYENMVADPKAIIRLNTYRTSTTLSHIKSVQPLARLIRQEKPDVVVSIMDMVNLFTQLSLKFSRWPAAHMQLIQTSTRQSYLFHKGPTRWFLYKISPYLYRKAECVVALSEGVRRELLQRLPAARQKHLFTIHNIGISAGAFEAPEKVQLHAGRDPFAIVCCGRLVKLKGFDLVIRAAAQLSEAFPQLRLYIVGDGPERAALQQLTKALNIEDKVIFTGMVKDPETYFRKASIFVLSSHFEGFGNVIVEAMASGAAVVAADCPFGPAEIIDHEHSGLLVPLNDAGAIAQSIATLFLSAEKRNEIAVNGYQRAKDFLPEIIAAQYQKRLNELCRNKEGLVRSPGL